MVSDAQRSSDSLHTGTVSDRAYRKMKKTHSTMRTTGDSRSSGRRTESTRKRKHNKLEDYCAPEKDSIIPETAATASGLDSIASNDDSDPNMEGTPFNAWIKQSPKKTNLVKSKRRVSRTVRRVVEESPEPESDEVMNLQQTEHKSRHDPSSHTPNPFLDKGEPSYPQGDLQHSVPVANASALAEKPTPGWRPLQRNPFTDSPKQFPSRSRVTQSSRTTPQGEPLNDDTILIDSSEAGNSEASSEADDINMLDDALVYSTQGVQDTEISSGTQNQRTPKSRQMKKILVGGSRNLDYDQDLMESPSRHATIKALRKDDTLQPNGDSARKKLFLEHNSAKSTHHGAKDDTLEKSISEDDVDSSKVMNVGTTRNSIALRTPSKKIPASSVHGTPAKRKAPVIPSMSATRQQIVTLKRTVLTKLNPRISVPLCYRESQYQDLYALLRETILRSESNSALLFGPHGSGRSLLLQTALQSFHADNHEFLVVKLDGLIQTDDRMALRAIARQLQPDNDEIANADIMTALIAILSHPRDFGESEEPLSTIIILDHFEKFTEHPRQTLLYNLFDIAQSKKAPICVLGLTSRVDAYDSLEKRVKSRFSHRVIQFSQLPFDHYRTLALSFLLCVDEQGEGPMKEYLDTWNTYIRDSPDLTHFIRLCFLTNSDIRVFISSMYPIIATLGGPVSFPDFSPLLLDTSSKGQGKLDLLECLSLLELSLLIAAARLEIKGLRINFATTFEEYRELAQRSTISQRMSGISNFRIYSKATCQSAWQDLLEKTILVPLTGMRGTSALEFKLVRVEIRLSEISGYNKSGRIKLGHGMHSWLTLG